MRPGREGLPGRRQNDQWIRAFVAYPAEYRSGVMTFIIGADGVVYERI